MRTDTVEIPTVRLCAWCRIPLGRVKADPVQYKGWACHPGCAEAAAAEASTYPEPELADV